MKRLLVLLSVAFAACGFPGDTADSGTGDAGTADAGTADAGTTISLSGARTTTFVTIAPTAAWTPSTNTGELSLVANSATEHTSLDFFFEGVPAVRTYVGNTDAGITCSVFVYLPSPSLDGWLANHGSGIPDLGECSLTFTSVALSADHGTQKNYAVHGSVAATLPARSGTATGSVSYSAAF